MLRLLWRGTKTNAYLKRWDERFTLKLPASDSTKSLIWIHAVSMGEVEASRPLISSLQALYPGQQLLISTMTPTGSTRVSQLYGQSVLHCYLPYDLPLFTKRFLSAINPSVGIIMETELWPNLLHQAQKQSIPMVLANARMSSRSAEGYKRINKLCAEMLNSFTLIAAQSSEDRDQFISLGASRDNVHAVGNLKFELDISDEVIDDAQYIRSSWGKRSVFIAASTHEGEEILILNALRQIKSSIPDVLLILVPRHPERFDRVAAVSQRAGFKILRRSEKGLCRQDIQIFVIDSMGELPLFYAAADIAFVGGSLVPTGGHNILEPAAVAKPIIVGPHVFNFKDITRQFIEANAAIQVQSPEELAKTVITLFEDSQKQQQMGKAAKQLITQSQGASQRLINLIKRHIDV